MAWVALGKFPEEFVYLAVKSVIKTHCQVRPQVFKLEKTLKIGKIVEIF